MKPTTVLGRQVFSVTETIWCVRQLSYYTCSYAIRTPQGIVLVDAGMDSTALDIECLLEAMGEPLASIRAILLTHWHNDHAAGARVLQEKTGCGIYYHQGEEAWLTGKTAQGGLSGWFSKRIPEWGPGILLIGLLGEAVPEPVTATAHITDGQVLFDDFEVITTPGHTVGHVSFYYTPEKALFAGDALAVIGQTVRFMSRPVTLNVPEARASMIKCLSRDIQRLCPGHRRPLTENVSVACDAMRQHLENQGKWPLFG
jgi:glyoxylase-like metal-dependent hydrolase (beta-lactamase superfamily II)